MHCRSCEIIIEKNLKKIPGVHQVHVSYHSGQAEISYEGAKPSNQKLALAIEEAGYELGNPKKLPWISTEPMDYEDLLKAGLILIVLFFIAKSLGIFNIDLGSNFENTGLIVALVVGLVAGISTCMALVGGLVLGLSARHAEMHPEATPMQKFRPHLYFNLGRIIGYAILGGMIGLLGSVLKPSPNVLGVMTIIVGGVMIFLGLKLIEIFPALRDKSISLPSSISKLFGLHKDQREYNHSGAILTGALTFFLPCGFTQAMQLYAVSTGSFFQGALIMGLFALGTAPGLLGVGGLSSIFRGRQARLFFMVAGLAVIFLGTLNVTNGRRLISSVTLPVEPTVTVNGEFQEVRMTQGNSGYTPNVFTIQVNKPVRWIINSTAPFSCASSLVVPSYGVNESLKKGENIIEFTPAKVGEIPFSCSMGMYRGKFIVIEGDVLKII